MRQQITELNSNAEAIFKRAAEVFIKIDLKKQAA